MTHPTGPLPQILQVPLLNDAQSAAAEYLEQHFRVTQPLTATQIIWCNTSETPLGIQVLRDLSYRWAVSPGDQTLYVVLLSAETLSAETQNALLKTLEEPPVLVQFILVTAFPNSLLPTVVSRCQLVTSDQTSQLSKEMIAQVTTVLAPLKPGILSSAIVAGEQFTDRETARQWLHTALVWSETQHKRSLATQSAPIEISPDWVQWEQALLTASAQLTQNGNVKLIMSELFFSYLSATDK